MKIFRLIAALLAMGIATPAAAQNLDTPIVADTYDQGDWWWLDTTKRGPNEGVLLVDGEPVRQGDKVEIYTFLTLREAKGEYVGMRIFSVIDCKTREIRAEMRTMFLADARMQALEPAMDMGTRTLEPETVFYQFACNGDRQYAKRYGKGSRRAIAADVLAKYPQP